MRVAFDNENLIHKHSNEDGLTLIFQHWNSKKHKILAEAITSFQGYDDYRIDIGKFGNIHTVVNSDIATTNMSFAPYQKVEGKYKAQTKKSHPAFIIDWQSYYDDIQVVRVSKIGDKKVYVVRLNGVETHTITLFVDAKTGDVIKQENNMMIEGIGSLPVTTQFEDYRNINGLRLPYKITTSNMRQGNIVLEVQSTEVDLSFKSIFLFSRNKLYVCYSNIFLNSFQEDIYLGLLNLC